MLLSEVGEIKFILAKIFYERVLKNLAKIEQKSGENSLKSDQNLLRSDQKKFWSDEKKF